MEVHLMTTRDISFIPQLHTSVKSQISIHISDTFDGLETFRLSLDFFLFELPLTIVYERGREKRASSRGSEILDQSLILCQNDGIPQRAFSSIEIRWSLVQIPAATDLNVSQTARNSSPTDCLTASMNFAYHQRLLYKNDDQNHNRYGTKWKWWLHNWK